jgi:hypothetical protein
MTTKWLLLLLLVVPGVAAEATNEGGILHHETDTFAQSRTSPAAGQIFSRSIDHGNALPHYAINHTHAQASITYTATIVPSSAGVWLYTFTHNGTTINDCSFRIQTVNPGVLGGAVIITPHFQFICMIPGELGSSGTFAANRASETGSPSAISSETISYQISTTYHLEPLMSSNFEILTGFTATEFTALLGLAIVGVILWSRSTDYAVRAFGAALPIIAGAIVILVSLAAGLGTLWAGAVGLGAILIVIGAYLQVRMGWDALTGGPV